MSRLDRLIAELCPGGVEFVTIEQVCEKISSGGTPNTARSDFYGGDIPWLRTQEVDWANITETGVMITAKGLESSSAKRIPKNCVIVAMYGATAAKVAVNKIPLTTNQAYCNLQVNENKATYRYVYYWLCNKYEELKSLGQGSQSNINAGIIRNYPIPLPPLAVQREIVRILDNFTELTARKKQYAYYRDKLLSFGDDVATVPLGELGKNLDSKRRPVTKGVRQVGKYPYYGASGIVDYVADYIFEGDFLLVSEDGANLLTRNTPVAFSASGKIWVNNHAHVLQFNTYEERRFIEFYLNAIDLSCFISTAAQPKLNKQNLNKIPIPQPSFEKQTRIVAILDRFDALVTDISSGLPAEIAARQKQYEYYRDKLLLFEKLK
ncbi:MAG: restriction endonuclease subunit S [Defluviitaleaceae bacterium]|nr:restriction endonuclease subunit S [Defluviitaleaceae bacterium]